MFEYLLKSSLSSDSEDIDVESESSEVESGVTSESDSDEENIILFQLMEDLTAIRAVIELYKNKLYKRPTITNYLDVVHGYSDEHVKHLFFEMSKYIVIVHLLVLLFSSEITFA